MKKYALMMGMTFALTGCLASGPEKPIEEMAKALEERDAAKFLQHIDMKRFAASQVQNLTEKSKPLHALDSVGKFLGLGGVNDFLGTVLDAQKESTEYFTREVSTGELILQCTQSQKPDCPWVPDALLNAKVKELSATTAVVQVTTPTGMTSWLALAQVQDVWKVVGHAALENEAAAFAKQGIATGQAAPTQQGAQQPQQSKEKDPYAPAPPPAKDLQKTPAPNQNTDDAPAPPPPVTKL